MSIRVHFALLFLVTSAASAQRPELTTTLPKPEINEDSWVMIEIWPDVRDVTLSAYFLDFSYEKNRNLCEVAKRVFDREQEVRGEDLGRTLSSYRICLSVRDAKAQGYVRE